MVINAVAMGIGVVGVGRRLMLVPALNVKMRFRSRMVRVVGSTKCRIFVRRERIKWSPP